MHLLLRSAEKLSKKIINRKNIWINNHAYNTINCIGNHIDLSAGKKLHSNMPIIAQGEAECN